MPTLTTAVRDLIPGDVIFDPLPGPVGGATSYAVLDLAIAEPGPVGLKLARLGPLPSHLDRVATVSWPAAALLGVRRREPARPAAPILRAVGASGELTLADYGTTVPGAAVTASAALVALGDLERAAKAGPTHTAAITERAATIRAALLPPDPATGVPGDVARALLRQAELFEQLFGLHDVLDVAYIADNLRAAAGVAPIHDGPTSERAAAHQARRERAEALLVDVERLAGVGHVARVELVDGEPRVSSANAHESVEQAVNQQRAEAWRKLEDERDALLEQRDTLAAELLEERNK
jgi:hypothetical protein